MTGQSDRYKLFTGKLIRLIVLAKRVAGKPGRAVTALSYGISTASAWAVLSRRRSDLSVRSSAQKTNG